MQQSKSDIFVKERNELTYNQRPTQLPVKNQGRRTNNKITSPYLALIDLKISLHHVNMFV